jgi:hypothetical protein
MTIDEFKLKLKNSPENIVFSETIAVIEGNYTFTPSAFKNGSLENSSIENLGSSKVFSFAIKEQLTKDETLACFGAFYFNDVLKNLNGKDHQNIRNFIKTGFDGLKFENETLVKK